MKKNLFLILILIMLMISCKGERTPWGNIQDFGGIKVFDPIKIDEKLLLPIECDGTGLTEITVKPKKINSAPLFYTNYSVFVKDFEIGIILYKELKINGENIKYIELPNRIKQGRFKVYYVDTDDSKIYLTDMEIF